jgi:hypothetical protein
VAVPRWEVRAVRPWWTRVGTRTIVLASLAMVGVVLRMAVGRQGGPGIGWWAVPVVSSLLVLPVVFVLVYLVLRRRNMRLVLDDGTLTYFDVRGRPTVIEVCRITTVFELTLSVGKEHREFSVPVDIAGTVLLTLWHKDWDDNERGTLWSKMGRRVVQGSMPAAQARDRFPGLRIPMGFLRPVRTAVIGLVCFFAYGGAWVTMLVLTLSGSEP